jgi:hypothetical protein
VTEPRLRTVVEAKLAAMVTGADQLDIVGLPRLAARSA